MAQSKRKRDFLIQSLSLQAWHHHELTSRSCRRGRNNDVVCEMICVRYQRHLLAKRSPRRHAKIIYLPVTLLIIDRHKVGMLIHSESEIVLALAGRKREERKK